MHDNAGTGVLGVGIHWATAQAIRIQAMIATHGKIVALGLRVAATLKLSDPPPQNVCRVAVLLIASHLARPAANALRHVEVEPILLALCQLPLWNQRGLLFHSSEDEAVFRQAHQRWTLPIHRPFVKW